MFLFKTALVDSRYNMQDRNTPLSFKLHFLFPPDTVTQKQNCSQQFLVTIF